jgi:hypothetical protein
VPIDHFQVPRLRSMMRDALPKVIEGVLAPLGIFYLAMWLTGVWGAVFAALGWSWGAIGIRLALNKPVPGLLLLGAIGLTARSLVAVFSHSMFVYFLQPTLGGVVIALAFIGSVAFRRPLASKLAGDFLAMPEWFAAHPEVRRYFARITLLFGGIQLLNSAVAAWLLMNQPVAVFLAVKTAANAAVMAVAVIASGVWFNRMLRDHQLGSWDTRWGVTGR